MGELNFWLLLVVGATRGCGLTKRIRLSGFKAIGCLNSQLKSHLSPFQNNEKNVGMKCFPNKFYHRRVLLILGVKRKHLERNKNLEREKYKFCKILAGFFSRSCKGTHLIGRIFQKFPKKHRFCWNNANRKIFGKKTWNSSHHGSSLLITPHQILNFQK